MSKRAVLLVVLAVCGAALATAATAYACTVIRGQTYASATSGAAGASITLRAAGARPSTAHYVHFLNFRSDWDAMRICMSRSGVSHPDLRTGAAQTSSSTGAIASRAIAIPRDVHASTSVNHPAHRSNTSNGGPALFCHITSGRGYGTRAASVTVL